MACSGVRFSSGVEPSAGGMGGAAGIAPTRPLTSSAGSTVHPFSANLRLPMRPSQLECFNKTAFTPARRAAASWVETTLSEITTMQPVG